MLPPSTPDIIPARTFILGKRLGSPPVGAGGRATRREKTVTKQTKAPPRSLTPYQAAQAECSHWVGGECSVRRTHDCLVGQGNRCQHFEDTVLPLADQGGLWNQTALSVARDVYRSEHHLGVLGVGVERPCKGFDSEQGCGQPLPARRRLCDSCRQKARRRTWRESKKGKRGVSTVSDSGSGSNPPKVPVYGG